MNFFKIKSNKASLCQCHKMLEKHRKVQTLQTAHPLEKDITAMTACMLPPNKLSDKTYASHQTKSSQNRHSYMSDGPDDISTTLYILQFVHCRKTWLSMKSEVSLE